jgi:hypothetical protein
MSAPSTLSELDPTSDLTLRLPAWVDTNETYMLVDKHGNRFPIVYDLIQEAWCLLEF